MINEQKFLVFNFYTYAILC